MVAWKMACHDCINVSFLFRFCAQNSKSLKSVMFNTPHHNTSSQSIITYWDKRSSNDLSIGMASQARQATAVK